MSKKEAKPAAPAAEGEGEAPVCGAAPGSSAALLALLALLRLRGWIPRGLSGGSRGGKGQRRGILQTHDRAA